MKIKIPESWEKIGISTNPTNDPRYDFSYDHRENESGYINGYFIPKKEAESDRKELEELREKLKIAAKALEVYVDPYFDWRIGLHLGVARSALDRIGKVGKE